MEASLQDLKGVSQRIVFKLEDLKALRARGWVKKQRANAQK
jgi:hypothetical protein